MARRYFAALIAALFFSSSAAHAGPCSAPAAPEGKIIYNYDYHTYQYCNGTSWIAFDPRASLPTCGVTSGLVSYWKFDEGSGSTASDATGGNTGTLVSGPTWSTGKVGGALSFNGTSQYVSVPLAANLRTNTCSIAMWVKSTLDADETPMGFAERTSGITYDIEFGAAAGPSGGPLVTNYRFTSSGTDHLIYYTTASRSQLLDGQWHHFVITGDGTSTKMYIDNVALTPLSNGGGDTGLCTDDPLLDTLYIGGQSWYNGDVNYFNGSIDDVRFYNRAISASEVSQIYNSGAGCLN